MAKKKSEKNVKEIVRETWFRNFVFRRLSWQETYIFQRPLKRILELHTTMMHSRQASPCCNLTFWQKLDDFSSNGWINRNSVCGLVRNNSWLLKGQGYYRVGPKTMCNLCSYLAYRLKRGAGLFVNLLAYSRHNLLSESHVPSTRTND